MSVVLGIAMASLILGLGGGAMLGKAVVYVKQWGRIPVFLIRPGTNNIVLEWQRPIGTGFDIEDPQNPVRVPWESGFLHSYNNKRSYLVNRNTGSPVRLNEEGKWEGLDGRSWYYKNRCTRIPQIQRSGNTDLEKLLKYALMGLVVLGLMILIALGLLGKMAG